MVDERDEHYEDEEEDEYHFSDDQLNFEVENETPKTAEAPIPSKESFMTKMGNMSPRRRALLAGIIFIVLIGIVYKMLKPSTSPTSDVLSEINTAPTQPMTTPVSPPVVAEQKPIIEQPVQQPVATVVVEPTPAPATVEAKKMEERLNSLEQQSSAMMNLLQNEYAQKISDYEMQSNLTRGKMDELSKRISRIESNLNQITQMLREGNAVSERAAPAPTPKSEPKIGYTVQAIIPGRAWLKSESGDTVTVAEGDILRNYGRIAKIDPYDGIVEIDTGSRIIALSYGMNVE
jgi:hypothetical protein